MKSKKGQLSVFIILGILIAVVLILIFSRQVDIASIFNPAPPIDQIEDCVKESAKEGIEIVSLQGGSIAPENYYGYDGNKVEYLCYNEENYKGCVMQKPLLKESIENELKEFLDPRITQCIKAIEDSLEKKGYSVSFKEPEINIELASNNVIVSFNSDLKIAKDKIETYETIKTSVESDLYRFAMLTSSILNWEARYGDIETISYMVNYPSIKVEKKKIGEGTKIYILTRRDTLEKFMFATRSVALPAGVTGE